MRVQGIEGLVRNAEVYGLEQSLIRSGYPMLTKTPNEGIFYEEVDELYEDINIHKNFDSKHIKRGKVLGNAKRGSGHDTALKGVIVQFDLDFTIKAWTEAERYHWFDFVSSCSTMHKLKSMDLSESYNEYVDERIIEIMKELQQTFNTEPTKENELKMLYSNPVGMRLVAGMTTNYLQLKTIYGQRKNHRLPEWREFCKWCETLPMFKELCLEKENKNA